MTTIPGYIARHIISDTNKYAIYKCTGENDDKNFLIKILKDEYPSLNDIAMIKYEYAIKTSLDIEGVIKACALEKHGHGLMLIMEDFGDISLKAFMLSRRLDTLTFLTIAIQLASILGTLHQHNIIHKDINPHNILLESATGQVKITGLGLVSRLSQEHQALQHPSALEGTLAYISPEQTGRMNRPLDYRTDLYSLGVTLYEMLTGDLPFSTTDPLELVHCHIARQPPPPQAVQPEVPPALSHIVMKLLAKDADDRYKSAYGLKADLQTCLTQWTMAGRITARVPSQREVSDRFYIPHKLYGREADIASLMRTFERVSQGTTEMLLVYGYAGIGKSTLVHEIQKPVVRQTGYFAAGKFDQFQRDVPYSAFLQAFRELVRQFLTEGEAPIARWRTQLLQALGTVGQVIVEVLPELELIIGKQPAVPQLAPAESTNRFHHVFQEFMRVCAQKHHPLVLFLDDLQWADSASLQLLRRLIADPSSHHVLLIGAYRDNEVSAAHPLLLTLQEMERTGGVVSRLALTPLSLADLSRFIADIIASPEEEAKPLAELVYGKTDGNPFFVIEFMKALHQEKLLVFDVSRGVWCWDEAQVQAAQMTDNVVELMTRKIQKLPPHTQSVVKLAACIGNRFDLQTLAIVCEQALFDTADCLWEAIQEGLVLPIDEAYKFLHRRDPNEIATQPATLEDVHIVYAFSHDRVQQAAYALIPEAHKHATHLQIGRLLLDHTPQESMDDRLFDMVNHLNAGLDLIRPQEHRDELAQLNLRAGQKAKSATAYEQALSYLTIGSGLLSDTSWETQYRLTFSLYMERAECAYLTSNFSTAEDLFKVIAARATTTLDQVAVYSTRMVLLAHVGQFKEAIEAGIEGLKLLNLRVSAAPGMVTLLRELCKAKWYQGRRQVTELSQARENMPERERIALNILMNLWGPTFWLNQNLNALIVLQMVQLSLRYGNADVSAFAYAGYGMFLSIAFGNFQTGYTFGNLALQLTERFTNTFVKGRVIFVFSTFLSTYKLHNTKNIDAYREGFRYCLESGDLVFAGFCAESIISTMPMSGYTLDEIYVETQTYLDFARRVGNEINVLVGHIVQRWIVELQGFGDQHCDVSHMLEETHKYAMAQGIYHLFALQIHYLFGRYDEAIQTISQLQDNAIIKGHPAHVAFFYFYYSLTLTALYRTATATQQRAYKQTLKKNQRKLHKWADSCPENFLHKSLLVSAEMARVFGADRQAEMLYDQAIEAARKHEYVQHEAHANELAAQYYLARGKLKIARTYMTEARYGYLTWGAQAKVQALDTHYPQLLTPAAVAPHTPTFSDVHQLDLTTVTRASQAIASEMVLPRLLDKLMHIVIENAGAERGLLILDKVGHLVIEAEKTAESDEVLVLQSIPIETRQDLPLTLVRYVQRTHDSVVLNEASREGLFTTDTYIVQAQPKSVLCVPLLKQGRLTGIVYLENNLTTGAFTAERLTVLHLLSSHEAIAIDNARLYSSLQEAHAQLEDYSRTLQQRIADRTRELQEKNQALEIANQQILAATERKTQFFNNMSHELRTPLDAIIGFSEVLEEQAFGDLNAQQMEYVNYILTSGTHLHSLINDLLDLAKLDAQMMELQLELLDLRPLIESTVVMIREQARAHDLTVSVDIPNDVDAVVGDARRVTQILLNLLSNAVKFTPAQGTVGIRATRAGERVAIAVWDTGIGIAAEDQQRIFEEFQQVKDKHRTKIPGTGLGLALTKRFVELHGGTITVESGLGQGSTFTFSLPTPDAVSSLPHSLSERRSLAPT